MALFRVRPTKADVEIANAVSRKTNKRVESAAQALTWGADEHVLLGLAAAWWLYSRGGSPQMRRDGTHILVTTALASALPHLLKTIFDQERPDRRTLLGHLNGVPFSGKSLDAFPSGHSIHVGALTSAATVLAPRKRNLVWVLGGGLMMTRIVLLAHWASDVLAGLAIGVALERFVRVFTGYGSPVPQEAQSLATAPPMWNTGDGDSSHDDERRRFEGSRARDARR